MGCNKAITLGNEVDATETEFIDYLADDPETRVIGLYIEEIKGKGRFLDIAKRATRKKPVVILKGGVTEEGAKAVASHTASLAGNYIVYEAMFKQSGIIQAYSLEEFLDYLKIFSYMPLPRGNKLGVVSTSGTLCILTCDASSKLGLEVPKLPAETQQKMRDRAEAWVSNLSNPVDSGGDRDTFKAAAHHLFKEPNIDMVSINIAAAGVGLDMVTETVASVVGAYDKPFALCVFGSSSIVAELKEWDKKSLVPVYPSPDRAARALNALYQYTRNKEA